MRVRTTAIVVLAVVGAAALAAAAAPAPAPERLIRPGRGIGPVELGMTLRAVKRALGQPAAVARRDEEAVGGEYVELQWVQSRWTVGLRRVDGALRVVRVATTVPGMRTSGGTGPGSRPRQVLREFPRATCVFRALGEPWPGTWLVAAGPGGAMTAFAIFNTQYLGEARPNRFVIEVVVQERWYARSPGDGDCGGDWRREFRRSYH